MKKIKTKKKKNENWERINDKIKYEKDFQVHCRDDYKSPNNNLSEINKQQQKNKIN